MNQQGCHRTLDRDTLHGGGGRQSRLPKLDRHANANCFCNATGVLAQLALARNVTQCTITGWDRYGFGRPGRWHHTTLPDEVLAWAGITRDFATAPTCSPTWTFGQPRERPA